MSDMLIYALQMYALWSFVYVIISSIVAGYIERDWNFNDIKESIFWPLSLANLIGLLIRVLVTKRKEKKNKPVNKVNKKENK